MAMWPIHQPACPMIIEGKNAVNVGVCVQTGRAVIRFNISGFDPLRASDTRFYLVYGCRT